jgi:hypothetical protein
MQVEQATELDTISGFSRQRHEKKPCIEQVQPIRRNQQTWLSD